MCLCVFVQLKKLLLSCKNVEHYDGIVVVLASSVHSAVRGNWVDRQITFCDRKLQSLSKAHPAYHRVAYL